MPLSVIDVVLKHRDPVRVDGAIPIGSLAPIVHQPHPGEDREQVFVVSGTEHSRLLVWRTATPDRAGRGPTRFLVREITADQWRGLLDSQLSVARVLGDDGPAVRVTLLQGVQAAGVSVEPVTVRDDLPVDDLPAEYITDDNGKEKRNRPAWLGMVAGTELSDDHEGHRQDLVDLERLETQAPRLAVTAEDGGSVANFGRFIVAVTADSGRTVRRFPRQVDARVAVERAGMR